MWLVPIPVYGKNKKKQGNKLDELCTGLMNKRK